MTTKEQERKALIQIKKIVASLGEDSYIGTAFEGCFEIAEENIENDFACSMKQRVEAAEANAEKLADLVKAVTQRANELEDLKDKLTQDSVKTIERYNDRLMKMEKKSLSVERYKQIWNLCYDQIETNKAWMDTYADTMADFSDTPTDIAFIDAAKNYKKCRAAYEEQKALLDYLDTINPEA